MSRSSDRELTERPQAAQAEGSAPESHSEEAFQQLARVVGFGQADSAALQEFAAQVKPNLKTLAGEFSKRIARYAAPAESESVETRLCQAVYEWLTGLLEGPHDKAFLERYRSISERHLAGGVPYHFIVAGLDRIHARLQEMARGTFADQPEKLERTLAAIRKAIAIASALSFDGLQEVWRERVRVAEAQARRRLEEQLADQQSLAKALLDSAPLGIMAYDSYGEVTVSNAKLVEILGYDVERLANLREWVRLAIEDPEDRQEADLHFAAVCSSDPDEGPSEAKFRVIRPDGGERIVHLSSAPIRNVSGQAIGGVTIATDATQQQQLEQNLIRAERLAAIGELAASLAHEIKNPLAGISGAIQIIKERFERDDPHREIIDEIQHQIARLDNTVRDLLIYARPTPLNKQPTDLAGLIDRVLTVLARERQFQPLQIIKHYPPEPIQVDLDPDQFEQVCMNIVLNAAQAMTGPGQLVITLQADQAHCTLTFTDSGPGMPPQVARRAFEPFFTTKTRGTGLGLPICKKIVEAHGGEVELQTAPQKGTTIILRLPR